MKTLCFKCWTESSCRDWSHLQEYEGFLIAEPPTSDPHFNTGPLWWSGSPSVYSSPFICLMSYLEKIGQFIKAETVLWCLVPCLAYSWYSWFVCEEWKYSILKYIGCCWSRTWGKIIALMIILEEEKKKDLKIMTFNSSLSNWKRKRKFNLK